VRDAIPALRSTTRISIRRLGRTRLLLTAAVGLAALALLAWGAWQILAPPLAGESPPLTPLAGVVYEDSARNVNLWVPGEAAPRRLLPPPTGRRDLLAVAADGSALAYLEAVPAATPDSGAGPSDYDLRVWRSGGAPRTVPLPPGATASLDVQFAAGGLLTILQHPTSRRPGPLYLYDPDAGRLRLVAPVLDSFAVSPGLVAYSAPVSDTTQGAVNSTRAVAVVAPAGSAPATPVAQFRISTLAPHPLQFYYEPAHNAFIYSAARPTGTQGNNSEIRLGMFLAAAPGKVSDLPLQTNDNSVLELSATGRYLLYGGSLQQVAPGRTARPGSGQARLAALDWSPAGLAIRSDTAVEPPGFRLTSAGFVRGRDLLALSVRRTVTRDLGGLTVPDAGAPVFLLYDPAANRLETVLDNAAATLLEALDSRRLLLAVNAANTGLQNLGQARLVLAERVGGGWTARDLGADFPVGTIIEFAGLLPGGNTALIYAAGSTATSPRAAFYTVPLDGSARTQAFALPDGAFYAPVTVP
jgi:hypothetical protein